MTGAPVCANAVGKWTLDYLGKNMSDYPFWKVQIVHADKQYFQRIYGEGLGEGAIQEMSFAEFARRSRLPGAYAYYLQTQLLGKNADTGGMAQRIGGRDPFGSGLRADMQAFAWPWLEEVVRDAQLGELGTCQLWIGRGGALTPAHYDALENLFAQILGHKRFLLFPPEEVFSLYPYPVWHTLDSYSMVDFDRPDVHRFPRFREARGLEAVVGPGDVLYLPTHWFHHVHALPGDNVSLSFWFERPPAGSLRASFQAAPARLRPLLAARVAESAAHKAMGVRGPDGGSPGMGLHPGEFLSALATGRWPAHVPEDVRQLGERVRAELADLMGGEAVAGATLQGMTCDGRLRPGPLPERDAAGIIHAEKGTVGGYWCR